MQNEELARADLQDALDWACALGRMCGGHAPTVMWKLRGTPPPQTLLDHTNAIILAAIDRNGGNISAAAAELQISRETIYKRIYRTRREVL